MNFFNVIKTMIEIWLDGVTRTILMISERFGSSRLLCVVEQDDGFFRFESTKPKTAAKSNVKIFSGALNETLPSHLATLVEGARIELILHPKRFLFRSLELPRRASDFLDGIIRAQIDRLTPWTAEDALFGYATAVDTGGERINVTIVATARSVISPHMEALSKLKAQSIVVSTRFEKADATIAGVKLLEQIDNIGGTSHLRIRRRVRFALIAAVVTTMATVGLTSIIGMVIENEKADISGRIATRRAAITANKGVAIGADAARRTLEQRKRETPLSVIVLEVLSHTLPDDTYLTELRIQGNKLQIVGMTRNAPALISLIEQSSYFNRATFYAPTTRAPDDAREHFHIEVNIKPGFVPRT